MQDNVLAIVMAVLLVFFLWSVNRKRTDRRFRMWVVGWTLVVVHFLSLLWQPSGGLSLLLRQAHIAAVEILAGLCFVLSDPAVLSDRRRMLHTSLLGVLPTLGALCVILFFPREIWMLYIAVVVANGLAFVLARIYCAEERGKLIGLTVVIGLSTVWMLGTLMLHHSELMMASIPAEIFLMNAILFASTYTLSSPGAVMAVAGFVLWAGTASLTIALRRMGISDAAFPSIFYLPEFFVAIGMTMIALEEDAETAMERAEEYQTLFNSNPNSVWIYECSTLKFLNVNEVAAEKHGYTVEELLAKNLMDIIVPERRAITESNIAEARVVEDRRAMHLRKDGTRFPVSVTSYNVRFHGRAARMSIGVDLTEREQLIYQLEHDVLTALPNRRKLLPLLAAIFAQAQAEHTVCAVLVLQIERFEKINEIYGYTVGDGLLLEVATLLRGALHPLDALGRTGGSEYTIGLANLADADAAMAKAQQMQDLFEGLLEVGGARLEVAVTIGVAAYPEDCDDMAGLWRDAIRAHALARRPGARTPARLSRSLSLKEQEDNRLELLMRHALLADGFEVYYQPILDRTQSVCGMEALVRLRDEAGKMISPAQFIPVAESTGIIVQVGDWVLHQACRQLRSWQVAGHPVVPIAVNVSAHQLAQPSLLTDVEVVLEQFALDPTLLHLEVTESSVMLEKALALENMSRLSALGIRFSIDDFGTGYSSLDRLHQLPVSTLKIDRTFVLRMLDENGTRPIVATIVSMAHALGLSVIAEGVETPEQHTALREMGCDQFQGFLFSRPVPAVEATALFR